MKKDTRRFHFQSAGTRLPRAAECIGALCAAGWLSRMGDMKKNVGPHMSAQTMCDLLTQRPDLMDHPNLSFFKVFMSKFSMPPEGAEPPRVLQATVLARPSDPGASGESGSTPGASGLHLLAHAKAREDAQAAKLEAKAAKAAAAEAKASEPKPPKKPSNQYACFVAASQAGMKASQPDLPQPELMRLLGEKWKSMGEEDRVQFVEVCDRTPRLRTAIFRALTCLLPRRFARPLLCHLRVSLRCPLVPPAIMSMSMTFVDVEVGIGVSDICAISISMSISMFRRAPHMAVSMTDVRVRCPRPCTHLLPACSFRRLRWTTHATARHMRSTRQHARRLGSTL